MTNYTNQSIMQILLVKKYLMLFSKADYFAMSNSHPTSIFRLDIL